MKHKLLKFNHGVEIGAYLAYKGHYYRTKDPRVLSIALDEFDHRMTVLDILADLDEKPSRIFDTFFTLVGTTIKTLCAISPEFLLNFVARSFEFFAVISYTELTRRYPLYKRVFEDMARTEKEHEQYFRELGNGSRNFLSSDSGGDGCISDLQHKR